MSQVVTFFKIKKNPSTYRGFSLLEILIALVLGSLLFELVLQNYLATKKIYRATTELAYLNENFRFANFVLWHNITQAGYFGCRKISELKLINHLGGEFKTIRPVYGYTSDHLPNYLKGKVVGGTDVIVIAKANADITKLMHGANVKTKAKEIKVQQNPATEYNKYLLISDCKKAELFIAQNYEGKTVHLQKGGSLKYAYKSSHAEVGRFEELAYFISDTGRRDEIGKPIYGLYFSTNRGDKRELVEGVSDMQIYYGVDPNGVGKISKYLRAEVVSNNGWWDKVISVFIELKMQNRWLVLNKKSIYIKLRERG